MTTFVEFDGAKPEVHPDAWVAPGVVLVGRTSIAERASVWYGAVLRADMDSITLGARSNIQDGCVVHTDFGFPTTVGEGVSVGHRAVLHGCTVGDDVLVGMGAVVLNGARVGDSCLIAAGTVVLEGTEIPPGSLVAGVPGKVRRQLTDEERERLRVNAQHYLDLSAAHAASHANGHATGHDVP
ncbi:gamma carbonic anhydrase family protein [Streptomyces sp. 4N509B]|uniref:gamma carbonic anhydrase family protein n=1 Tax=Streptomyces sp. 4N509B TaxID=3457413 RepID=UPI003FD29363